jgi:hypothetical protein
MKYFTPRSSLSVETLSDNALEIYENACARMLKVAA